MEAHISLANRVASLENIFRQDERTMTMVLQRLKAIEEYITANGGRLRGDDVGARVDRALDGQMGRMEALNGAVQRQGAAAQVVEERLGGALRAVEQKLNGDVAGCHQRLQALELSVAGSLRGADAALQALAAKLQSAEQQLRGDVLSVQQRLAGDVAAARQRTDAVDAALRAAVAEAHRSLAAELAALSDTVKTQLPAVAQGAAASVAALEQRVAADAQAVQHAVAREAAAQKQRVDAQDAVTREALHALHSSVAADIGAVAQRLQAADAARQATDQQLAAEIEANRQQMETNEANWRTSIKELNGHMNAGLQGVRAEVRAAESAANLRITHTDRRVDDLQSELRKAFDAVGQTLGSRITPLERLRDDVTEAHASLRSMREEQLRLREEMKGFALVLESGTAKLRAALEASVRASHTDMLERMKPLSSYRNELHAAITAAIAKVWSEASGTFVNRGDMQTVQKQINVLDKAVRNEVMLLAEKNRELAQCAVDELNRREVEFQKPSAGAIRHAMQSRDTAGLGRLPLSPLFSRKESKGANEEFHGQWRGAGSKGNPLGFVSPMPNASTALTTGAHASSACNQELFARLLDAETGVLQPILLVDELSSMWVELRMLQKHLGMPREDVLAAISECRRYIIDTVLTDTQRSEEELRTILAHIEQRVRELADSPQRTSAIVTPSPAPSSHSMQRAQSQSKSKKTIIRIVPRTGTSGGGGGAAADGGNANDGNENAEVEVLGMSEAGVFPPLIKMNACGEALNSGVLSRDTSTVLERHGALIQIVDSVPQESI